MRPSPEAGQAAERADRFGRRRCRAADSVLPASRVRLPAREPSHGRSPVSARFFMPAMKRNSEIQKIAFVGDYLPRKCGIATFTYDLCTSVATQYPGSDCFVRAGQRRPAGVRLSAGGAVRDRGAGARFVPAGGRLPQFRQYRHRLPAARVRHLRRPGRQPHPRLAARPADADRHDAAHRAARARRRAAPGALPDRRAVGPAGRDVRARPHLPARYLRRPGGQDRPDRPRHPRHAVRRSRISTRTSSASRGSSSR